MQTDPIDQVARDQIRLKMNAVQHAVTEAKQMLDNGKLVDSIRRLNAVRALAVFDPDYIKLLEVIEKDGTRKEQG